MARDDRGDPFLGTVGWVQNNVWGTGASRAGERFSQESPRRLGRDDRGTRGAGSPTDAVRSQKLLLGRHTASEEERQERKGGSEANKVRVKEQISEMGNRVPGLAGGRRRNSCQGLFEMSRPGGHRIGGCRENRCGQRPLRWPCRILHTLVFLPP